MFFVAGITGQVGGATARRLLKGGHAVRALARDPQKAAAWAQQGVDVRQGDFNDAAAVAAALEGVEGAFLMLPPILTPDPASRKHRLSSPPFARRWKRRPRPGWSCCPRLARSKPAAWD